MINFFINLNPVYQALLAGLFTFFITSLGSSIVFMFKTINKNILDAMLALSAGIMLSASFFSLLEPAIDLANLLNLKTWLIVFLGFISGGLIIFVGDLFINYLSKNINKNISDFKRCIMLFSSITLHNIPEGLVIGVAFGAIIYGVNSASLLSALTLTLGIAIQNFPEGCAISLPLRRDGVSRFKSFVFGSISAIVEPVFAILGALLVLKVQIILPFILSFTAGAMVFVINYELVPESQKNKNSNIITLFLLVGFCIMMILELVLS